MYDFMCMCVCASNFLFSRISKFGPMHECLMECYDFMLYVDQIEGVLDNINSFSLFISNFIFFPLFHN
jgi:hypothetical protein